MSYLKKHSSISKVLYDLASVCKDLKNIDSDEILAQLKELNLNEEADLFFNACNACNAANKELFKISNLIGNKMINTKEAKRNKEDFDAVCEKVCNLDDSSFEKLEDIFFQCGLEYFHDMNEAANFIFDNVDGGHHYQSKDDILNEYGYTGDEKNVVSIDLGIDEAYFFNSQKDARRYMLEQVIEHNKSVYQEIKNVVNEL